MHLYRVCVWLPGEEGVAVNGHPLHVWPHQGAGRVDDPEGGYLVLYVGDSPAGAVAEFLGNYARWTPDVLMPPPGAPAQSCIALAHFTATLDVLDLDDPYVLTEWGLRPSSVVTRDRGITQAWASQIHSAGEHDGVAWWSFRDPRWTSYGLWDTSALVLADQPEPLTLDHDAVDEAARVISRMITT